MLADAGGNQQAVVIASVIASAHAGYLHLQCTATTNVPLALDRWQLVSFCWQ